MDLEVILLILISLLILIIIYLSFRLYGVLRILKTVRTLEKNKAIPKDNKYTKKSYLDLINETATIVGSNVENVPEKTKETVEKAERYKSESEKLKVSTKELKKEIIKITIENLKKNLHNFKDCNCYFEKINYCEEDDLREICAALTEDDGAVLFLVKDKKEFFSIICASDDLVEKGFDSEKIAEDIAKKINGKSGGKKSFAMIKGDTIDDDFDVFSYGKDLILKELDSNI
ncbi:MAG: hypothetical protein KAW45_04095 [Thermoplasmatales archaeon]|nr:hypothetical protein [Thermoplasmatales archaeon]